MKMSKIPDSDIRNVKKPIPLFFASHSGIEFDQNLQKLGENWQEHVKISILVH